MTDYLHLPGRNRVPAIKGIEIIVIAHHFAVVCGMITFFKHFRARFGLDSFRLSGLHYPQILTVNIRKEYAVIILKLST